MFFLLASKLICFTLLYFSSQILEEVLQLLFSFGLFLYVAMLVTDVILFSHFIFMTNFK